MERNLNPVTSISEKDRARIKVIHFIESKVAGYSHTACVYTKKELLL